MSLPEAPRPPLEGAERRMVEIDTADAGRLAVHVSELGAGEPVLMLHGWPQHAGCWRRVAPLVAERHRVICPDLRGFGGSDAPGRGYDPQTFASDAAALLDALSIDRVGLVGHDWGGYSGFLLALGHPERITGFVACSTPLPWVRLTPRIAAEGWRSWYAFVMAAAARPLLGRRPDLFVSGIRGPGLSEEEAWDYTRLLARPESARATELLYRAYLRTFVDFTLGRGSDPGRLTVPTRVLHGTRDPAVSKELLTGDHSRHADDLQVELVEGAGHFVPEERPELVAERALALFAGGDPRKA